MAKVVIDANIIISAAFGGKPLEAAARTMGKDDVYISRKIEQELTLVLSKLSQKLTEEQFAFARDKINVLIKTAIHVEVSARVALGRDAKDDHYLSLCKEIQADFLITGDRDLLSISQHALEKEGIQTRILNPHEFLEVPG
jgi:uncharacterized protein